MNEDTEFNVNYDNIVKEKSLLSITRMLAADMTKNPYMTIGDFFKNTSDSDIQHLIEIIDSGENHENFGDLMLISIMLAAAEGCQVSNVNDHTLQLNMFGNFVIIESLYRKGLVKIHRENMSFGEDLRDAILVEKLDENN
jgi:hypothetical protein